ncbi:hypothetical protein PENOC_110280 [Penicillium occitanis (nom. inval.)]|nr:hypothetical protein PENOC_110280 [Penicillium occitanis (nom. inval.)]
MVEKLESSSNDTAMNPPKRMLDASCAEYNASKRTMITCDNVEDMLGISSSEAQHGVPQLFEEGPPFETVDMFAPPLFSHYPQPPVDNFDPPFFTSSLMDHIAQGDIPDNTTELFLNADLASHEMIDQWARQEYP